ncbi:MAG: hypothetical protein AAF587_26545 [Bacteroidota bacterium]
MNVITFSLNRLSLQGVLIFFILIGLLGIKSQFANAQDLIVKKTDGEIVAKVREIQKRHILYNEFSALNEQPIKIAKSKVEMIIFEDGMKQYFVVTPAMDSLRTKKIWTNSEGIEDLYERGQVDADMHFDNRGAKWGTFGATVGYPLGGIFTGAVTGAVISAVPVNPKYYQLPNPELYRTSPEYAQGYNQVAKKKKFKRAITGFGLGLTIQAVVLAGIFIATL